MRGRLPSISLSENLLPTRYGDYLVCLLVFLMWERTDLDQLNPNNVDSNTTLARKTDGAFDFVFLAVSTI